MACTPAAGAPCRANLDLMPGDTAVWMYALSGLAFAVFLFGVWQMVHVWRMGRSWKPGDWRRGLARLASGLASHRKFRQDRRPGLLHGWVFFGFTVLFIGTVLVAIDADLFEHGWRILTGSESKLLFGNQYLLFEATLDLFGILFVAGLAFLLWRRYHERPKQLHRTELHEAPPVLRGMDADLVALVFLLLIGVTGFVLEAMRLRVQVEQDGIDYASWSFVGNALAFLLRDLDAGRVAAGYPFFWWLHFMLWTTLLAILPWTKVKHILTSSLNLFFHDPKRQSLPSLPTPFNLQRVLESGAADIPPVGVQTIRDLTWKDRLSLDACTNCGRCESQCPATAAGRPLSPRKLIQDLKAEMWGDYWATRKDPSHQPRALTEADGVGPAIQEATLWSCTTCRACVTACPVDIEHVDMIVEMRRGLVMRSKLDENQTRTLVNIANAGNPYGFAASDRANWMAQLPPGVVVPTAAEVAARGEKVETLWWIGCAGSFDPRNQKVTVAVATILNAAGVRFAVLGTEERCTADPARRIGEEGRFQQSALENIAMLRQYGVRQVITQCPHCFNAHGKEYPEFAGDPPFEVVHHSQLIERLVAEGKVPLKRGRDMRITYHDACYLMRHNGVGEEPRAVLRKANGGLPVLEMAQSGKQGLCCGAGGANFWYEVKDEAERINVIRAKQAAETGADTVATACPFCLTMMSDGLGLVGQEGKMVARDLAEIVAENLDWTPPAPAAAPAATVAGGSDGGGWSG
jgi:Fe-S oxidoreductase/nitrate reductase gamma subunit